MSTQNLINFIWAFVEYLKPSTIVYYTVATCGRHTDGTFHHYLVHGWANTSILVSRRFVNKYARRLPQFVLLGVPMGHEIKAQDWFKLVLSMTLMNLFSVSVSYLLTHSVSSKVTQSSDITITLSNGARWDHWTGSPICRFEAGSAPLSSTEITGHVKTRLIVSKHPINLKLFVLIFSGNSGLSCLCCIQWWS